MNEVRKIDKPPQKWTKWKIIFISLAVRIIIVLYSNIHDYIFKLNFTDIDYYVFSDAASYVAKGESPFKRATYRYTPVLAWILVPNTVYKDFGKIFFCVFDLIVAMLCFEINRTYSQNRIRTKEEAEENDDEGTNGVVAFWLANPLTLAISARGNADSLVCAAVLLVVYLLQQNRYIMAAFAHGALAVHLKIYPLIYLPVIFISLSSMNDRNNFKDKIVALITNWRGYLFALISVTSFAVIVFVLYGIYGNLFLEEYLLYHFKRRDLRHNFSPYFLPLYLAEDSEFLSKCIGYFAFIPQLFFVVYFAFKYSKDLPFCFFLTTFSFVALNKVCTSQYFVWYIALIPILVDRFKDLPTLFLVILWFIGQGLWLLFAYLFEFQGLQVFELIWISSLIFVVINFYILRVIIQSYTNRSLKPKHE